MTRSARRTIVHLAAVLLAWQAAAGVCAAEMIVLNTGRALSVKSHRFEGSSIVLTLRSGGEVTCDASLVSRIAPDEVPYPEPGPPAAGQPPLAPVPYGDLIDQAAARAGIDARLVRALIQVESAYQPGARSLKGAMGLMQLMPETARRYAVSNPYDPGANIDAGTRHLKSLLERFDVSLALAAYNAGEAAVERFGGIPPYPETRSYVRQVLQLAGSVAAR
jgi:hypothetical protein